MTDSNEALNGRAADILVVDDLVENLKLLSVLLSNRGYKVRPAQNGPDAIEAVARRKPDLILLDIRMPGMDGFEVCSRLQSDPETRDIPIIFVTASVDPEGAAKGLKLGAVDYINKPFREEEVLARVKTQVELYRLRRHLARESEENKARYQRLVEGLQEEYFFYSYSPDGVFNYLSPSFEQVLGYPPAEVESHYSKYLTDNVLNRDAAAHTEASLRGERQPSYEVEAYRRNGERCRLEVKETPLLDERGILIAVEGIAHDISERIRAEKERLQHEKDQRRSLQQTVQAIALTLEQRDPYTAGHQRRVADLACAIAHELGLDADTIEGIHTGAAIHDIGKIQIPHEILAKPTRLDETELKMIQTHSEAGYSILKEVEFPWPVAQMIHQHHERLDGKGYPLALKGDAICLEARIIMVADVVEAMASDRPYRPAVGIEAALEEIEAGAGSRYDPDVAAACVNLFRNKDYRIVS
ncbi:MAG: HD domain-containing phosphohydrolase [Sedimenticola sp.]